MKLVISLIVAGLVLASCGEGGKAPSGPSVNFTNRCQTGSGGKGGAGGSSGDTNINIDVNCPKDSNNNTAEPFVVPVE